MLSTSRHAQSLNIPRRGLLRRFEAARAHAAPVKRLAALEAPAPCLALLKVRRRSALGARHLCRSRQIFRLRRSFPPHICRRSCAFRIHDGRVKHLTEVALRVDRYVGGLLDGRQLLERLTAQVVRRLQQTAVHPCSDAVMPVAEREPLACLVARGCGSFGCNAAHRGSSMKLSQKQR